MSRKIPGINRLLVAMKKLIREVNDREICRRLEILMNTEKEDLPQALIRRILEIPPDFEAREVAEPYTQYVKHYMYMVKREEREREKAGIKNGDGNSPSSIKKKRSSKKAAKKSKTQQ